VAKMLISLLKLQRLRFDLIFSYKHHDDFYLEIILYLFFPPQMSKNQGDKKYFPRQSFPLAKNVTCAS